MDMKLCATTIVAVKRNGKTAIAGDGQVTLGNTVFKSHAKKIRRIYDNKVMVGFAGSVADAQTLCDKFEGKLRESGGVMKRAVIEFAKEWRCDKVLRNLEAMMIVANKEYLLILSGNGEVLEPDEGIAAIGSGGMFAASAAKALVRNTDLDALTIVKEAMKVASDICIYTNSNIITDEIEDN